VSSFIGLEQNKSIVEKYDRKTLYPMLLKCYHHLHPLFENLNVDQRVDENYTLDIFEMIANTNEPTKEFIKKEFIKKKLLIFRRFQMNVKNTKVTFNGGRSMNLCFLLLDSSPIKF
jgi:hypothetical protein